MKRFFIIAVVVLVVILALVLVFKKADKNSTYDFILNFDDAEKIDFNDSAGLNTFSSPKPLTFDRVFIMEQVRILFSGDVEILSKKGTVIDENKKGISKGGFRGIFSSKEMRGIYNFYFKKMNESNYWVVELAFLGESSDIKIKRCKDGNVEVIERFNYQIKGAGKKIFNIIFFSDFLVLTDKNNVLFLMRDPGLEGNGKVGLERTKGISGDIDSIVKFARMTTKSEVDMLDWHKTNLPETGSYKFNALERSWNYINFRQNLIVNGKTNNFLKRFKIGNVVRPTILFKTNASLRYTLKVPENGVLKFYLSAVPLYVHQLNRLRFVVKVEQIGTDKMREKNYDFGNLKKIPNKFIPFSMDLKEFGGSKCHITFKCGTTDGKILSTEKKILFLLSSPAIYPAREDDDYNVILISLDTLRASNLGCYGYQRETSRNMDEFALRGTLFSNALACSNWTLPSHMSMFTSLYPLESGFNKSGKFQLKKVNFVFGDSFISDEAQTIAGYLQEAGYETVAIHGGAFLSESYGFDKGFTSYERMPGNAEEAVKLAIKNLEEIRKNKFFMFFHTYEIHEPYKHGYFLSNLSDSEKTLANELLAKYDSGIRYTDVEIGKLIDWLKKNSLFDKTLIIITSDHGENFENLKVSAHAGRHGLTLYDAETHIPLILGGAARFNKPGVIKDQVSSVDILPTIMDFLDIPLKGDIRGTSLMPLIDGKDNIGRLAYSEATGTIIEKKSVRSLHYKLIATLVRKKTDGSMKIMYELYDLQKDRKEKEDIFYLEAGVAKDYMKYLNNILRSIENNRARLAKSAPSASGQDKELLEDLKGLGYIGN